MNKWIFRLTGILVVILMTLFFLDDWLYPSLHPAILEGSIQKSEAHKPAPATDDEIPAPPPLGLLSLQGEDDVQSAQLTVNHEDTAFSAESEVESKEDNGVVPPVPEPSVSSVQEKEKKVSENPSSLTITSFDSSKQSAEPVVSTVDSSQSAKHWLQAGSFSERANANKRAAVIKAQGWNVDIVPAKVKGKMYHRVYVGPIKANQVAAYLNKLQAMGIKAQEVNR